MPSKVNNSLPFVVLRHEVDANSRFERGSHFDLMVHVDDSLTTWAIDDWPLQPGQSCAAIALPAHRLLYLDYQGPISGNRGAVTRVEKGACQILERSGERIVLRLETISGQRCVVIVAGKITAES